MKKFLTLTAIAAVFMFSSCKKDSADGGKNTGDVTGNGWKIGSTNYSIALSLRNIAGPSSIGFFDAAPSANNLNTVVVFFNKTSGIKAGSFKVVTKPDENDLLTDEIMIGPSVGYSQSTGQYNKQYASALGQTITATVTITGGKAKIVIPSHNIVTVPINASATTTTFAGTLTEQ
ncbi:MAG: hypothetical protein ACOVQE_01170 [Chitinophagaceae bacterium]